MIMKSRMHTQLQWIPSSIVDRARDRDLRVLALKLTLKLAAIARKVTMHMQRAIAIDGRVGSRSCTRAHAAHDQVQKVEFMLQVV